MTNVFFLYRETQDAINCVTKFNTSIENNEFGGTCIPFGSCSHYDYLKYEKYTLYRRQWSIYITSDTRFFNPRIFMPFINPNQTMPYRTCNTCKKKVKESSEKSYWWERCQHHKESFTLRLNHHLVELYN